MGDLRAAAQAYLDAENEPAYSWVYEGQRERRGEPNREKDRMARIDAARDRLRAALAVLPVNRVGVDHDTDIDGAHWNGCPGCAADRVGVEPLDVAWAAAEAALPEGWALAGLYLRRKEGFWRGRAYRIGSSHPFGHSYQVTDADVRVGDGATPSAALQALATRLIELPTEGET